jgi:Family of unknown function (DUF6152)
MQKTILITLALLVGTASVFAHHGTNASYDPGKSVTLTGTITEWIFSNPHSQLFFDVKDGSGKVVHWGGELQSPANLRKDGWSKTTFKAGDQITLTVHPSRAGTPVGVVDRSKPVVVNGKPLPGPTPETE